MSTIINLLTKNPESSNCKTRLKELLTVDERIFLSKKPSMNCWVFFMVSFS